VKLVGPDGPVLAMNPAGLAMVEVASEEEVVGRSMYDLVCPEHHATFLALNEAVRTGEFENVGCRGTRRWMETPSRSAPGRQRQGLRPASRSPRT